MAAKSKLPVHEVEIDGEKLLGIVLQAIPVDELPVFAPDVSKDSQRLLGELNSLWPQIWPKLRTKVKKGIRDYDVDQELGRGDCVLTVCRMEEGCFMSDKSDMLLRLQFPEPPLWDCFLKGASIAHFQAVF